MSREPPQNRLTRAQRVEQWNAAGAAARVLRPRKAIERVSKPNKARYAWLEVVMKSGKPEKGGKGGLQSISRLVAHTLTFHGRSDGSGIFPSVRTLANETGLSERAVCEHIGHLVRRGFLMRKARGGHTAGARGFEYVLTVPTRVLTDDQHITNGSADGRSAPRAVLTHDQHSADAGSESADAGSERVLTERQPSVPSSGPYSGSAASPTPASGLRPRRRAPS